jgi:hypothetical protein
MPKPLEPVETGRDLDGALRNAELEKVLAHDAQTGLGRLAVPAGFEPATRGVEIRYSIQLSYGTVWGVARGAL